VLRQNYDLPGSPHRLTVLSFGTPGSGRKAYLQAGLHADEFPGMLVLRILAGQLAEAEARGGIHGEILLVPQANPIGLAQTETSFLSGRIENGTGENFNRNYADLSDLGPLPLGPDAESNVKTIRAAMSARLAAMQPEGALAQLRHRLLTLAHDADLVLDLHADNEAEPHMYVGPALWPAAEDIAAAIDARAVLLSEVSGGSPFDEACASPWWVLAANHPDLPIPPACVAATLELGSNDDVNPEHAAEHRRLGDWVHKGDLGATVIDPLGEETELSAETDGRLFARHSQPYAWPGRVIGKIAGEVPLDSRTGNLLSD
jgi:predicted deacylase